jgi:hypothetical protein
MTTGLEIINPNFDARSSTYMIGQNFVKINVSSNVDKFIKTGKKYVIELPDTNTILNVTCTFAAIRCADMKIKKVFVNGELIPDDDEYTISYRYETFDGIYYTSFAYLEKCNIYASVDDIF